MRGVVQTIGTRNNLAYSFRKRIDNYKWLRAYWRWEFACSSHDARLWKHRFKLKSQQVGGPFHDEVCERSSGLYICWTWDWPPKTQIFGIFQVKRNDTSYEADQGDARSKWNHESIQSFAWVNIICIHLLGKDWEKFIKKFIYKKPS